MTVFCGDKDTKKESFLSMFPWSGRILSLVQMTPKDIAYNAFSSGNNLSYSVRKFNLHSVTVLDFGQCPHLCIKVRSCRFWVSHSFHVSGIHSPPHFGN